MIFVCFLFNKIRLEQWILFLLAFPMPVLWARGSVARPLWRVERMVSHGVPASHCLLMTL